LITMQGVGDIGQNGFIAYAGKLHLVAFDHDKGENALVIGVGAVIVSFYDDAHGGDASEAVGCHDDPVYLDYGIFELIELGMHGKRCGKY